MSCILALAQISIADKHINYGESRSAHTVQAVTQKMNSVRFSSYSYFSVRVVSLGVEFHTFIMCLISSLLRQNRDAHFFRC